MVLVVLLAVILSFNAIYSLIPIIVIIIVIAAAAGLARGYDVFSIFGIGALIGFGEQAKKGLKGSQYHGTGRHGRGKKAFGDYGAKFGRQLLKRTPGGKVNVVADITGAAHGIAGLYRRGGTKNQYSMNQEITNRLLASQKSAAGSKAPPPMAISPAAAITGTATPLEGSLARKYNKQLEKSKKIGEQYRSLNEKVDNPDEKILFHKGSIYLKRKVGFDRSTNEWQYEYQLPIAMRLVPIVGTAFTAFRPRSLNETLSRLKGKEAKATERSHRLMQMSVKAQVGKAAWNRAKADVKAERVASMKAKHFGYDFGPTTLSNLGVQLGVTYKMITNRGYREKMADRGSAEKAKNAALQRMVNTAQENQEKLSNQLAEIQNIKADIERPKSVGPGVGELSRVLAAKKKEYESNLKTYGMELKSSAAVLKYAEPRVEFRGTGHGLEIGPVPSAAGELGEYLSHAQSNNVMAELPGRYEDKSMWGTFSRAVKLTYTTRNKRASEFVRTLPHLKK